MLSVGMFLGSLLVVKFTNIHRVLLVVQKGISADVSSIMAQLQQTAEELGRIEQQPEQDRLKSVQVSSSTVAFIDIQILIFFNIHRTL